MALGIKNLYSVRDIFPQITRKMLLNVLVVSILHYSLILLSGISENLLITLEKQLNWGIKAYFNCLIYDHSSDLKIQQNVLPVRYLFQSKNANFYWKWKNKKLPAFAGKMKFPTGDIRSHKRTKEVYFNIHCKTDSLKKSFFNKTVPIWNELPDKLKIGKCTNITTKKMSNNTSLTNM